MPCKDGSLKWVMDSGRKTKTPEGNTIINSIYLDITKDEEARQSELNHERRTKQQYYDLLSSINSNYYFIYLVNLEDGSGIPLRLPETECAVFTSYSTNGLYDIEPLVRSHFHPDDSAKILEHFSLSGLRRQKKDRQSILPWNAAAAFLIPNIAGPPLIRPCWLKVTVIIRLFLPCAISTRIN